MEASYVSLSQVSLSCLTHFRIFELYDKEYQQVLSILDRTQGPLLRTISASLRGIPAFVLNEPHAQPTSPMESLPPRDLLEFPKGSKEMLRV